MATIMWSSVAGAATLTQIDDGCKTGQSQYPSLGAPYFDANGPTQYWHVVGYANAAGSCYMWTTTTTSSTPINWAGWYLPLDAAHDGQYQAVFAFIPCQDNVGTARYRVYPTGTAGSVTNVYRLQSSYCNSSAVLANYLTFSAQSGGEVRLWDTATTGGNRIVVDLMTWRP